MDIWFTSLCIFPALHTASLSSTLERLMQAVRKRLQDIQTVLKTVLHPRRPQFQIKISDRKKQHHKKIPDLEGMIKLMCSGRRPNPKSFQIVLWLAKHI